MLWRRGQQIFDEKIDKVFESSNHAWRKIHTLKMIFMAAGIYIYINSSVSLVKAADFFDKGVIVNEFSLESQTSFLCSCDSY